MSSELQALKQELQKKGSHSSPQDEELLSAMREQVTTVHKDTCTTKPKIMQNVTITMKGWPGKMVLVSIASCFTFREEKIHFCHISDRCLCVFIPGVAYQPEGSGVGGAVEECESRKH